MTLSSHHLLRLGDSLSLPHTSYLGLLERLTLDNYTLYLILLDNASV